MEVTCGFLQGSSDFILAGMVVAGSHKLVGRASELARLLAALHRAEQDQPVMVLVAGDAGVGKTRLLAEVASRAQQRGVRVLTGGCVELGDIGLAYLPVVDALGGLADDPDEADLLGEVARIAPGLSRLLPAVAEPGPTAAPAGGSLDQLQVFDAVRAVLVRRSQRSPVLLVLEDLHWADRATRDLLAFLARSLRTGRVLLVGSYRADELHRRHPLRPLLAELVRLPQVERLELAPFSRAELAEHLEAITGGPLADDQVERIHSRSEGNPFYAEQLLVASVDDAQLALPETLADVLLARVQALAEPAQQVLRVAAVAGRRVDHRLLSQVTGWPEPDLEEALREAVGAGLLVADSSSESYAFRHGLLQEAVYADLLPGEQVRLHAAYVRLLAAEPDGVAAELAHHCLQSHDLVGALRASLAAAGEAAAVLAPAEALRHLTAALKLWERVPAPEAVTGIDRIELMLQAAAEASAAGDRQRAVSIAREAAANATADPARVAVVYERLGGYLLHAGRIEEALRALAHAVELVPAEPPSRFRARATAAMAQALINSGDFDEGRRWSDQALIAARAIGSAEDEADILVTLGVIEWSNPTEARSLFTLAQTRAVHAGNPAIQTRALQNLAWLEFGLGNLATARALFDEAAGLAQQTGLDWSQFGIMMRRGQYWVRYVAGDWDECERLAGAILDLVTTLAVAELAAAALPVAVGRGRPTATRRLRDLGALPDLDFDAAVDVAGLEADQALWQGDLQRATSAIQRALAIIDASQFKFYRGSTVNDAWICAVGLAAQAERAERARAAGNAGALTDAIAAGHVLLERVRSAMEQIQWAGLAHHVYVAGWLTKADAEWTRLQGRSDPKAWQAAVEAFSFGHVYEVARCRWRLAEALLPAGERERATVAARSAYETATRLGAAPLQAALQALARRGRLKLGVGEPPAPQGVGLTPRELEVLQLLMAGKSNRQIAEQLFISGKTASVHVTNILAKLGVHSRLEAVARARELGLDRPADPSRR